MTSSVTQDFLELAADYAEVCVLVTTSELTFPGPLILYANSAFTRMTGYSIGDLLGKTPRVLQGPETDREQLAHLREALEKGDDFIARTTNYKRDGTPFELEWIISHLRDEHGHTTHYVAVQRDITGKERARNKLEKYNNELRQAKSELIENAEKLKHTEQQLQDKQKQLALGQMAAAVMHDIGNAISPVFSLIKMLHTVDQLPDRAKKIGDSLDTSVEHALNVLSNLRQYYQNAGETTRSSANLQELVRKIPDITSVRWWNDPESGRGKLNFSINAPSQAIIECNEVEILQVLVNLVLNAIDAMPDGGTIGIQLAVKDDQALLAISDTGIGMTPEAAIICFDPYVTGRTEGTGLGLAVCKRIIEDHGGEIDVSTDQPQGVTFNIRLPLRQAKPAEKIPGTFSSCLIVGGNTGDSKPLDEALARLKIRTNKASGPDEALLEVFSADYDFVIIHVAADSTIHSYLTRMIYRSKPGIKVVWWLGDDYQPRPLELDESIRPDAILKTPYTTEEFSSLIQTL